LKFVSAAGGVRGGAKLARFFRGIVLLVSAQLRRIILLHVSAQLRGIILLLQSALAALAQSFAFLLINAINLGDGNSLNRRGNPDGANATVANHPPDGLPRNIDVPGEPAFRHIAWDLLTMFA
jgi:hypothetical protein